MCYPGSQLRMGCHSLYYKTASSNPNVFADDEGLGPPPVHISTASVAILAERD